MIAWRTKNFFNNLIFVFIGLIFISKISLKAFKIIPFSIAPIIYQWGIHPFINFSIQGILGLILLGIWNKRSKELNNKKTHPYYKILIAAFWTILLIESLFQIFFTSEDISVFLQFGALLATIMLSLVYGQIIPELFPIEKFVQSLRLWAVPLCLISLIPFIWDSESLYRGGRFVGLFKHIPHMVSCATIGFIFYLPKVFRSSSQDSKKVVILRLLILSLLFFIIILTGTRSSIIAALFSLVLGFYLLPEQSNRTRFLQWSSAISIFVFLIFFGFSFFQYGSSILSGEKSVGSREAQNGFESRMDEIFRGLEIFQSEPWVGKGLLYKYRSSDNSVEVGAYNSFKDPHNYFLSAGVVGGWPLVIWASVALGMIILAVWQAIQSKNLNVKLVAIYILSHIPILMIYHLHLSPGGIADRIYWLCFGYLALEFQKPRTL